VSSTDAGETPDRNVILTALAGSGWCVVPGFLSLKALPGLRHECLQAFSAGAFHAAGVGSGQARIRSDIRGDHICWLDETQAGPALTEVLARLEDLRQRINRALFLGLCDAELHFAVYPPGSGYKRHLDRFRDDDRRALTVILYLNQDWTDQDGGLLRFWPDENRPPLEILPAGGTLVTFLADRFWHEVLPARRQRLSLTGWFRRRA
jgi:SM-20-related protein